MDSHSEHQPRRPEEPRRPERAAPPRVRIREAHNPVDGSRLTAAEHVALARSLDLRPLADRQSPDETLRIVRVMAPDSREQGRLVAMWLPGNAPSDFVVELSGKPAPPEEPKKPGGDYLSFGLSERLLWFLLEAPTILTFQVSSPSNVVLASYPDFPGTTIQRSAFRSLTWTT